MPAGRRLLHKVYVAGLDWFWPDGDLMVHEGASLVKWRREHLKLAAGCSARLRGGEAVRGRPLAGWPACLRPLVLLLAGCSGAPTVGPATPATSVAPTWTPAPSPSPTAIPPGSAATPTDVPSGWQVYAAQHFSIAYPGEWIVQVAPGASGETHYRRQTLARTLAYRQKTRRYSTPSAPMTRSQDASSASGPGSASPLTAAPSPICRWRGGWGRRLRRSPRRPRRWARGGG